MRQKDCSINTCLQSSVKFLASGACSNTSPKFHSCSVSLTWEMKYLSAQKYDINVQRSWISGRYKSMFIRFHWVDVAQFPRTSYLELGSGAVVPRR
jgi:hypothetical protein